MKIGVVAASSRFPRDLAERLMAQVAARGDGIEVVFHPDSFLEHGHFAGEDAVRARAVLDFANDPGLDAVWFGRGGYGACRIAEAVMAGVTPAARDKIYLGYSDAGSLLAGFYRMGFPRLAHGPMVGDLNREGGAAAIDRALDWLATGTASALEPDLDDRPTVAFNITILSALLGTALEPDLSDHVVLLEDVSEPLYRLDRTLFHITSQASMRRIAGFRLGRVSDIISNDPDFGQTPEQIVRDWCTRSGIPYLGRADIGHDADNKIVPFGRGGVAERPR